MSSDANTEQTKDKFKKIEMGLKCLRDLNLLDDFFDKTWKEGTEKLLDKYEDKKSFHDLPLEETNKVLVIFDALFSNQGNTPVLFASQVCSNPLVLLPWLLPSSGGPHI